MAVEIVVPALGESVQEATVAKWLKKVGDSIAVDEPLVELETDKVTLEVNAKSAGVLKEIKVQTGSNVAVGAVLGSIGEGKGEASAPKAGKSETSAKAEPKAAQAAAKPVSNDSFLSPAVRKLVEDKKVDTSNIAGSGKDGRLTKGDVLEALTKAPEAPVAKAPAAPSGPRSHADREERVRMTRLRQRVAERLKDAQNTAAMLTTFNEVDMTHVMALRTQYKDSFEKKHGTKLGFMSFFVKAAVQALKDFPAVNAEIDGTDIVYKNYYDIGVAVSAPTGLIVPVLREADSKGFAQIEKEIVDLGTRARDGKLALEELSGGTFTITNGGIFGSLMSTPILNPPQSGILGMHKIQERPIAVNGQVVIRPMMYLALSYDHRIVDGKEAVSFLVRIKDAIEDPQRLLLDV
ncbi:MAG TPA: 2-oxoglutarate dehydrogenase complex dihydrolipoyllysine-residue succinyltransferase [Patescibacteria group bacterium]|nr:2-oxoglutarate dehydrogenase complex dihydrolipoyllysine-residue succinyltransferase [Patescibacteria group bacterium]